jgi:methionyl aminopeptidase
MISKAKLNLLKEKGNTVKVGRNDPCPCGSGLKYKRCCLGKEVQDNKDPGASYARRYKIQLKENVDISGIRKAGRLVLDTLDLVEPKIRPGMMTDDINTIVHEFTVKNGAQPAPLNYRGFPKSVCVSVNEEVCHGIPGKRVIADGDIVNVDVTSVLNGYYADANKTFFAGTPGPEARKIVSVAKECLNRGISMVKPGNTIGDIGWAIQSYAEEQGCSVVHELKILEDNWTAVTKDRSLSAQFEQTLLVTDSGFESLTPYDL